MKTLLKPVIILIMAIAFLNSCRNSKQTETEQAPKDDFKYFVEQFDDIRVLKYKLPDFDKLTLQQKEYIYYLGQAALAGRDIIWDQNFKYNLLVRKTVESIIRNYQGDKENQDYKSFIKYAKKIFFANGIHHHYSSDKFIPEYPKEYFAELVKSTPSDSLPLLKNQSVADLLGILTPVMFDPNI
jgi:dipeptidyl-peptidase-3